MVVILVKGASSGLGRFIAIRLCKKIQDYDNHIKQFNEVVGSADKVAKFICKKVNSKKLFLFPNLYTKTLYFTTHSHGY